MLLPDDSRAEFKALEGALLEDLRPEGALQTLLAHRLVAAAWRLARADRLEFGLLIGGDPRDSPGRALVRDGRAAAAFATLVRYRGGAQAELFRTLKALKELQAAAAAADRAADAMPPEPPVEGTPEPRPGVAALRLPAGRPALPPLGEVARPRVPDRGRNAPLPAHRRCRCDAQRTRAARKRSPMRHRRDAKRTRASAGSEPSGPRGCFLWAAGRSLIPGERLSPGDRGTLQSGLPNEGDATMSAVCQASVLATLTVALLGGAALAAPGDIHRVAGADVVNLRAGPSDESNIRGRVDQGDEVIELTGEGNWVGVRVLDTGEEGWIFGGLLERVARAGSCPATRG